MEQDWVKILGVFHAAVERAVEGQETYGNWSPSCCKRDLYKEAEEELLDTMVYCALQILKLRHTSDKTSDKPPHPLGETAV